MAPRRATTRGFARTASLLQGRIRTASESRGFAVTRLLTHWDEIVGPETARVARPVKVTFGRQGFGATLTVLTTGAQAPMLQADLPRIRDRVNACYGYNAISAIRITQTAPTGFSEGRADFTPAPRKATAPVQPAPEALEAAGDIADPSLRDALARLGTNIVTRQKTKEML